METGNLSFLGSPHLLACPFCGGPADLKDHKVVNFKLGGGMKKQFTAFCVGGCVQTLYCDSMDEAIATWNRRAPKED